MILIRLSLEDDRTIDNINIKFEADTEDEKSFCNSSLCNEFITEIFILTAISNSQKMSLQKIQKIQNDINLLFVKSGWHVLTKDDERCL